MSRSNKNRVLAFLLSSRSGKAHERAVGHLKGLAAAFGMKVVERSIGDLKLAVCMEGNASLDGPDGKISFSVGTIGGARVRDRFLDIRVSGGNIAASTDYAGTVPLFYSLRDGLSMSNLEPVVVLDSDSKPGDISPTNLYGFLRFSHLIWDETLWSHIYSMEPDSEFVFDAAGTAVSKRYLRTVHANDANAGKSDAEIARLLHDLNLKLVSESFAPDDMIRLPLSAGYDSRLIACALSELKLGNRCDAFSYGDRGVIEVESARRVSRNLGLPWRNIGVSDAFLDRDHLEKIGMIFGSSLHFHGMYQIETTRSAGLPATDRDVLTSGFMTGVPAGQHISMLYRKSDKFTGLMNSFGQSRLWTKEALLAASPAFRPEFEDAAERQFKKAWDRFDGNEHQKLVMFDVWTRQRNFISYHPKTIEWMLPFVAPHMKAEYANFFMSLSPRHLTDRKAMELMFAAHYPRAASVISNSNGIRAISGGWESVMDLGARAIKKLGLKGALPYAYRGDRSEFDLPALRRAGKAAVWPMFDLKGEQAKALDALLPQAELADRLAAALGGSLHDYMRLVGPQSVAYSLDLISR